MAFLADQRVDCRVVDISIGGIALWSPVIREPGQFLRVNFSFAPPGGIPRWYDADGVVVRVGPRSSGTLLGVQFVVIEDRVARDIHGYVAEILVRDGDAPVDGRMPDERNPPPFTGEFHPPETCGHEPPPMEAARRRPTAEYGTTEPPRMDDPAAQANAASTRRMSPQPTSKQPMSPEVMSSEPMSSEPMSSEPMSSEPMLPRAEPLGPQAVLAEPARPDAVRPAVAIPRTRVAAPTTPPPVPKQREVASKRELEQLFRDALSEVDSGTGGRKNRRTK